MRHHDASYPEELEPVAELLRAERPVPTDVELTSMRQRALAQADRSPKGRKHDLMRSRLAVITALALGFGLSTTGAGLAVTGFADSDRADLAQYDEPPAAPVLPEGETPTPPVEETPTPPEEETPPAPEDDVLGGGDAPAASPPADVQPLRQAQVTQGGGELPFTGFAAIPVLLLGLALLTAGLVLRRSQRED